MLFIICVPALYSLLISFWSSYFSLLRLNIYFQGLSFLLAMVLKALGPHRDRYYDSDEEYAASRHPLLRNSADPPHVADSLYAPRKWHKTYVLIYVVSSIWMTVNSLNMWFLACNLFLRHSLFTPFLSAFFQPVLK